MRSTNILAVVLTLPCAALAAHAQSTVRVSVDSRGLPSESNSFGSTISAEGRYVAFSSRSSQLVPQDTNGVGDVFVRDRTTGTTVRASVSTSGTQADAECIGQFLSADGRFVAFRSASATLVPGDTNGVADVFVRDLVNGTTERVSVSSTGTEGNGDSYYGTLSSDGRLVLFTSEASNLVANDGNLTIDAFVHDRSTGVTERVSVESAGTETERFGFSISGTISGDGRFVTFESPASNLVANDNNGVLDVFVHDRANATTQRISTASGGGDANEKSFDSAISADGRFVVFSSEASNLVAGDTNDADDIFVHDRVLGTTVRANVGAGGVQADADSYTYYAHTTISADGRFVVFQSYATNLSGPQDVNYAADIFARDLVLGVTSRISVDSSGTAVVDGSIRASLSATGRYVAFESDSPVLVAGDVNGATDVIVRDVRSTCLPIEAYCVGKVNSFGCVPVISSSGEPSATGVGGFALTAVEERVGSPGMFLWARGAASVAFGGGTLCLQSPIQRTPLQAAVMHDSASPAGTCRGAYVFAFGAAYMQAHGLVPGVTVYGQYLGRDAGFAAPNGVSLSDAIRFTICP